ncbi:Bro-N domain-containing protein [Klebsiella aerogenes]|uniref:Bro-N domain-containing protein n=1 Tax=Klebsiella aerogenes TaxID=548 RepID=UPI0034D1DB8D
MNTELTFRSHTFIPAIRDNKFWLTSSQIAEALEYSSTKSISNLYNQNEDEFTPEMTQVTESVTSGNYRKKVRIFSLRGAHLIAMFARTPVAKEFRRWVLDILDREVGQSVVQPIPPTPRQPTETPVSASMIIYLENGIPVASRPLMPGDFVMNANSCLEHVMRCGFVVIPWERVGEMSLDALYKMAEQAKRLNEQAAGELQVLAEKYGI